MKKRFGSQAIDLWRKIFKSSPFLLLSFLLLILLLPAARTAFAKEDSKLHVSVEIVSKRFSSGYLPVVDEYVEYQIKLTNDESIPIQNQSLWALFTSKDNRTHSSGSYTIVSLNSNDSETFFLGPYKMRETGEHYLFLGMNRKGDPSLPNGILVNFQPNSPVDSFFVYDRSFIQLVPISLALVILAAAITIGFKFYRNRDPKMR